MTPEQFDKIVEYARLLNSNIPEPSSGDDDLITFIVKEVVDRVLLYINTDTLQDILLRIVARLVASAYNKAITNVSATTPEQGISEVSDNGQTVKFSSHKAYFASSTDDELMDGFSTLLKRYRRVDVVGPELI